MLQENVVKVVSRYAVDSVTVYTIWRLFVFRYTCKPRHFDSRGALESQNAEACIHLDTDFLLVMLSLAPVWRCFMAVYCLIWPRYGNVQTG